MRTPHGSPPLELMGCLASIIAKVGFELNELAALASIRDILALECAG